MLNPFRAFSAYKSLQKGALGYFVNCEPSAQATLDVFRGEWASRMPAPLQNLEAGKHDLFQDDRVEWFLRASGGVAGKSILELGPLEGAHTWMLDRAGTSSITSIEGNSRAWLKCLVLKELLGMPSANFQCGNFVEALQKQTTNYDGALACGVLYHMKNPVELLGLLAKRVQGPVLLWTQFYDEAALRNNRNTGSGFTHKPVEFEQDGYKHQLNRVNYGGSLFTKSFYGGNAAHANWLTLKDLLGALEHFGYQHIEPYKVDMQHPNGPAITAVLKL